MCRCKDYLRKLIHGLFFIISHIFPYSLTKYMVKLYPPLGNDLPLGMDIWIDDYLGEFKIALNTNSVVERSMISGVYEPNTLKVIDKFVNEGDYCIDVGANVGAITFALARKVKPENGKVYAFEPGPSYYKKLIKNISLNPLYENCIVPENLGLSDVGGTLQWEEDHRPRSRGNAGIVNSGGITVSVTTIDDYVEKNNIFKVDFIKIDVEGWEDHVLMGARKTLATLHPKVLLETLESFNERYNGQLFINLNSLFKELDYELFGIDGRGNTIPITDIGHYESTLAYPRMS